MKDRTSQGQAGSAQTESEESSVTERATNVGPDGETSRARAVTSTGGNESVQDTPQTARSGLRLMIRALSAGMLGTALYLVAEAVWVGLANHATLVGPWELRVAIMDLVPIAMWLAIPALLISTFAALVVGPPNTEGSLSTTRRSTWVALIGVLGAGAAWSISTGRHFEQLSLRVAFVAVTAALGSLGAWLAIPWLRRLSHRPALAAATWTALAIVLGTANEHILHGYYPGFHVCLALGAWWSATWAAQIAFAELPGRLLHGSAVGLLLVAALATPRAATDFAQWNNVQHVYGSHAPSLRYAVMLLARLHQEPNSSAARGVVQIRNREGKRTLHWNGRSILLVSIDAMRPDHLGAFGYKRNTSPNFDRLAKRGVLFTHAYTVLPHTSYSVTSMMTGKYMRPLLLQGLGKDSDTLPGLLRLYGYRTGAFFPPSIYAWDEKRFDWAKRSHLNFEYVKIEYAKAPKRLSQVRRYLSTVPTQHPVFLWVHLFEPHEPYVHHPEFSFGPRSIDRYDEEIAAADATLPSLIQLVRRRDPNAVVIVTADHGESFGERNAYYHGANVYEEQVRVPLLFDTPGLSAHRVQTPVQLIDIFPTVLRSLAIPVPPRVRGDDLGQALTTLTSTSQVAAFSQTDQQQLLAESNWRLICARDTGACVLYDLKADPKQQVDCSAKHPEVFSRMRKQLRQRMATMVTYELSAARREGRGLPPSLVRAAQGDISSAPNVAALLEDVDVEIRRRAARALFDLHVQSTVPSLQLALSRDDDDEVKNWCAIALVRMGHGAARVYDLFQGAKLIWRRRAALALAESGDDRGVDVLIAWFQTPRLPKGLAIQIIEALGHVRARAAEVPLVQALNDYELRGSIAKALARIGDPYARTALLQAFEHERYMNLRPVLARSLIRLGAWDGIKRGLVRFLGVPDPISNGMTFALAGDWLKQPLSEVSLLAVRNQRGLEAFGGPDLEQLAKLQRSPAEDWHVQVYVPKVEHPSGGSRVVVLARNDRAQPVTLTIALAASRNVPVRRGKEVSIPFPPGGWKQRHKDLSTELAWIQPGTSFLLAVRPHPGLQVGGLCVIPRSKEIPPPAPKPWDAGLGPSDSTP